MAEKKVIVVVGSTGAQGGGLARAILAGRHGEFAVRAITRKPESDRAKALAAAGAEVVAADLDDQGSMEQAFRGAWGAFCVTNYWEHMSPERETAQAANMARAARAGGLRHVVWSSLEDTRESVPVDDDRMPTLKGRYKVPHFDVKAEADAIFRELGVPTTFLYASFYWDNLIHFGLNPKPGPDGTLLFALPMGDEPLPGIAAEDIGKCALGIFARHEEFLGRTVGVAGEHLTGHEMAAALSRALGREVRYVAIEPEAFRSLGFPGADDTGNMFQYYRDFNERVTRLRDVALSRSLNPELLSFEEWLARYKDQIPLD